MAYHVTTFARGFLLFLVPCAITASLTFGLFCVIQWDHYVVGAILLTPMLVFLGGLIYAMGEI